MKKKIALVFSIFLIESSLAFGQQSGDDSLTEKEKQDIRAAGKKMPAAELEKIIKGLDADRHAAWQYKTHPEQLKSELISDTDRMRLFNHQITANQFGQARAHLDERIRWLAQNKVPIAPEIGNELAETLIEIYEKRALYTSAPDHLPIIVAAEYGNSLRVKDYLKKILRGPLGPERDRALASLANSRNLKGDPDIYTALTAELPRKEGDSDLRVMGAMSKIDKEKALPFILNEVDTTRDVKRFIGTSGALSQYGRTDLLEHVLQRIADFPKKSWGDPANPTLGIYSELLLRYIKENEDEKLELALKVLDQDVSSLIKCPPVILEKLDKGTPRSRRAVGKFLEMTPGLEPFKKSDIAQGLQDRFDRESDPETRRALGAAIDHIRKNNKGGGHE